MRRHWTSTAVVIGLLVVPGPADAIPAFARRYKVSCSLCHNPIPKLTAFGEAFSANGFRFATREAPRDTIATGDPLLSLPRELPLAMRLDLYAQAYANGRGSTDFQTPYGIKLMSGGPLSRTLSYYVYTFLSERGGIGGIEDAYIQLNDIGGEPVDLVLGQYQISDPMFKRELRLEFEDYAVYRARVGAVPLNLTYDRGLMASADVAGFTLIGQIINGNGKGEVDDERHFDNDPFKDVMLHLSRDIVPNLRVGAFGLTGRSESNGVRNTTNMFGIDATLGGKLLEVNAQYLHRTDNHPNYLDSEADASLEGGFAELLVRPPGSRWYGFGLYNRIEADRPIFDVDLGTQPGLSRYETLSAGIGRLELRNFRWTAEATWDIDRESVRWTLGMVTAF